MISMEAIARRVPGKEPGDYTGPDGLLHCGKCHTPKECRVNGKTYPVICQCRKAERERVEREQAVKKRYEAAMHLAVHSTHDQHSKAWTFARDDKNNPGATNTARVYAERWEEIKAKGAGLLLMGGVGTGKSFLAGCIANALLAKKVPVLFTSFGKLVRFMTTYSGDKNQCLQSLNKFDLLVLDDLGTERQSSFALELVFEIVDERVKSGLPLIVSTNLTQRELYEQKDVNYARIYDRITSVCAPVVFNGTSRRKAEGAERLQWLNGVLFGDGER
jgi:DNA replication protein DnaC